MSVFDIEKKFKNISLANPALNFSISEDLDDAALMGKVREAWSLKYINDELDDPLYSSDIVDKIVLIIIRNWLRLEKYFTAMGTISRCDALSTGINMLITGTKGVGKSTLMKGLSSIIEKYGTYVTSMYIDYELSPPRNPSTMIDSSGFPDGFNNDIYEKWSKRQKKGVIFFGDEVQCLYEKGEIGVNIVRELLCLGKSHLAMGVISGSSSNVRNVVYKWDPDERIHFGFPNLNYSVYRECHLPPLRTKDDIRSFLAMKNLQNVDIDDLFLRTGGVGRHMHTYFTVGYNERTLQSNIDSMSLDYSLQSVLRLLYIKNGGMDNKIQFNIWKQVGLSFQDIRALKGQSNIVRWIDQGILYQNTDRFEFLFPVYMDILRIYYGPHQLTRVQNLAFEAILRGHDDCGSAGEVLMPLIIQRLLLEQVPPFNDHGLQYDEQEVYDDNILPSNDPKSSNLSFEKSLGILNLCNIVLSCKMDLGIDAFILTKVAPKEEGQKMIVNVTIIHINCGRHDRSIVYGKENSSSAPNHFTAIVRNAKNGYEKLLLMLTRHYSNECDFNLLRLVLVTSKTLDSKIKELKKVVIVEDEIDFVYIEKGTFDTIFCNEINALQL